jgi:pyruvate dehydrogenase E1 component alpha subunit
MKGRAGAFNIYSEEIDGQDVRLVYLTALRLVERARQGQGPSFLLCHTYRNHGHHVGDINRAYYRSKEEELEWQTRRDPLKILGTWLVEEGLTDERVLEQIAGEVRTEAETAVQFALNAPYPDPGEVDQHVYA